jgi:hypothetical protein
LILLTAFSHFNLQLLEGRFLLLDLSDFLELLCSRSLNFSFERQLFLMSFCFCLSLSFISSSFLIDINLLFEFSSRSSPIGFVILTSEFAVSELVCSNTASDVASPHFRNLI